MRWTAAEIVDQKGRVAIVTGANSGIGYETAAALARKGAHVVLACRSEERGRTAVEKIQAAGCGSEAELEVVDLSEFDSVRAFADQVCSRFSRLDLLINNAGVMMPPLTLNGGGFEIQFATNHLGHFALTGLLLPLLRKTEGSRVVTVSSLAHRTGRIDFDNFTAARSYSAPGFYGQSKLANLLFTYELRRRLDAAEESLLSVAAHPGWTATELQKHTPLFRFFNPVMAQGPAAGALPTLYAATEDDVRSGDYLGPGGLFELRGSPKKVASNTRANDRQTARRLWEVSVEATGVDYELG